LGLRHNTVTDPYGASAGLANLKTLAAMGVASGARHRGHLRPAPQEFGLTLHPSGWVAVDYLSPAMSMGPH